MWKVFLAFLTHRAFLVLVAVFAATVSGKLGKTPILEKLVEKAAAGPEVAAVNRLAGLSFKDAVYQTRNPFYWMAAAVTSLSGWRLAVVFMVLSNVFLLFFLNELVALFNRMVTSDISRLGAIFVLLWPTSYELSLGSSLTLVCFLLTLSIRTALEQKWLASGVAALGLATMDPIAITLLPVYLYLFWSVQRFLERGVWLRNLSLFLVPFAAGCLFSGTSWRDVLDTVDHSALFTLLQYQTPEGDSLFSGAALGQTLSLCFCFLGAAGALFSNVNPVHRFLSILVLFALVASSPLSALATRVPLAGVCMEGIASASSGTASRIVSVLMIALGAYEVYVLFSI
jgi:hypothetical protein